MLNVPIQSVPNQSLNFMANEHRYSVRLRSFKGIVFCDINIDDEEICRGMRCLPNNVIIPYPYLTKGANLYFECQENNYPDYTRFGTTQFLRFALNEELEALNG